LHTQLALKNILHRNPAVTDADKIEVLEKMWNCA